MECYNRVGRRSFVKILGLGSVVGAAIIAPSQFRDIDEVLASPVGREKPCQMGEGS